MPLLLVAAGMAGAAGAITGGSSGSDGTLGVAVSRGRFFAGPKRVGVTVSPVGVNCGTVVDSAGTPDPGSAKLPVLAFVGSGRSTVGAGAEIAPGPPGTFKITSGIIGFIGAAGSPIDPAIGPGSLCGVGSFFGPFGFPSNSGTGPIGISAIGGSTGVPTAGETMC